VEVRFGVEVRGARAAGTKSILPDDIENRLTQLTLASYGPDGILTDTGYYEGDMASLPLYVSGDGPSNIYALVNMGDMSQKFPESEAEVGGMEYMIPSYSDVGERGIPMSGILEAYSPGAGGGNVLLDRLFAKLRVRVTHNSLAGYSPSDKYVFNMCNRSLYVRQANGRLHPFSRVGSRAVFASDTLSSSDCNPDMNDRGAYAGPLNQSQLGPGPGYFQDTTLVFYVPENVQGKLLPDNDRPDGKVYESISDINGESYSDLCTYLEFNARREPQQGYSGSVRYRYYLGADNTSDFSLERNRCYDLTLDFTEDGFHQDGWRVSRGDDWSDTRSLCFVEEPFLVQPGRSEKVMVHYHRFSGSGTDSQKYPDEWRLVIDEYAAEAAGVSFSYDPDVLVRGENGSMDFCVNVSGRDDAVVGGSVPIRIETRDGSIVDESILHVVDRVDFSLFWNFCPQYVSQCGQLFVTGVESGDYPLTVSSSDEDCLSIVSDTPESFKVIARGMGSPRVTVSNASGTKSVSVDMDIKAPVLELDKSYVALNPDGVPAGVGYVYKDSEGQPLSGLHDETFNSILAPVVSGSGYFGSSVAGASVGLFVSRVYENGKKIALGAEYQLAVSASGCPEVEPAVVDVYVKDPFRNVSVRNLGRVDDFTLLSLEGTHECLKAAFAEDIRNNSCYRYDCDVPDASASSISAGLEPQWPGSFSYPAGVFGIELDVQSRTVSLNAGEVSQSSSHSVGRHDLVLYVTNRHSLERLSCVGGVLDVYVHTVVGARAEFGSRKCCYSDGKGGTFASQYNVVAERTVYQYPASTDVIYYADVSLEWMTDVSGVYLLDRMNYFLAGGSDRFDAMDIVRPDVSDGHVDSNLGMLYSVCETPDDRVSICGESLGPRKGIGVPLYRALLVRTFGYELSQTSLNQYFFGYSPQSATASGAYAPRYSLHDMNLGDDMSCNVVYSREPYYFSPSDCASFRDKDGRGYHVIHFLEEISPYTFGWMNLL
jgi:hypothetical protein